MRLQLTALALVCAASAPAAADHRAATWVSVYADDDGLTVVSPQVSGQLAASEQVDLELAYDVDVISAATVDVVSQASPRGYHEQRHGLILAGTYSPAADRGLTLRYVGSTEPDYLSNTVSVSGEREWIDRRLTTRLELRATLDRIGRTGDERNHWRDATTEASGLSLGWIASRWTVLQLAYELQHRHGYLANPYRFVAVDWPGVEVMVAEAVPDRRLRHAIAVGGRHALTSAWFLSGRYRLYADDWGVVSHAGEYELQRSFAHDALIAGITGRIYHQGAASFYRQRYQASAGVLPELRSADKLLASSSSLLLAVRADGQVARSRTLGLIRAVAKIELFRQHFDDVLRMTERQAVIVSLGLSTEL